MNTGGADRTGASGLVLRPGSWSEALRLRSEQPTAAPICGGTDLMVDVNFGRTRPAALLDLSGVAGLDSWELTDSGRVVRIGAGVTYRRVMDDLAVFCPALAQAARTVGSPQIRNRGTVGGNLATASPAGDSHPPLLAARASVEIESVRGRRLVAIDDFFTGPKRNVLDPDELIAAVLVPVATGPQLFAKIGSRNAMVIATVSFSLALDLERSAVGAAIGSAGPTPIRARAAERFLEGEFGGRWDSPGCLSADAGREFGARVAEAASPIDDVRGTARYRAHALSVLARRCLAWALADLPATHKPATHKAVSHKPATRKAAKQ